MHPEHQSPAEWSGPNGAGSEPNGEAGTTPDGHAGSNGRPSPFDLNEPYGGALMNPGLSIPFARPVLADAHDLAMTLAYARRISPREIPRWLALLESVAPLLAAIIGAIAAAPITAVWRPDDERWFTIVGTIAGGLFALMICTIMLRLEGRGLHSIGWTRRDFGLNVLIGLSAYVCTAIVLLFLAVLLSILFPQILEQENEAAQAIEKTFPSMPFGGMVLFMVFVAIWEEFAFRGFMLTRLQMVFRRWWLTLIVGAVLFGTGHFYQGPLAVGQTILLGLVLGMLFLWRRSLVPGIVFHLANNVVAFLLLNSWTIQAAHS